jgi:hypothetical protein
MDTVEYANTFPAATLDEAYAGLERLTGTPRAALEQIARSGASMTGGTELSVANDLAIAYQTTANSRPAE